jgi:hypothetical protein
VPKVVDLQSVWFPHVKVFLIIQFKVCRLLVHSTRAWWWSCHLKPSSRLVSLLVWVITFDLSGKGGPTSSNATAGIALGVIWPLKPSHYIKVEAPTEGDIKNTCVFSHTVYVSFLQNLPCLPYLNQQMISFNSFNGLVCITNIGSVFCEVTTKFL